jgi:hypothetical protein
MICHPDSKSINERAKPCDPSCQFDLQAPKKTPLIHFNEAYSSLIYAVENLRNVMSQIHGTPVTEGGIVNDKRFPCVACLMIEGPDALSSTSRHLQEITAQLQELLL